jgi:hypothetical protein
MAGAFAVRAGTCHPVFVFEVGFSIDLEQAARKTQTASQRALLQHRERSPGPFEQRPAPLRIVQPAGDIDVAAFPLGGTVELVLYDFGAASVSYCIPLPSDPAGVLDLSIALRGHPGLAREARQRITALVSGLGDAVQRPRVAEPVEDYYVFELQGLEGTEGGSAFCADHAEWIARVLRAEPGGLSPDEIRDATAARLSFGTGDVTVVDWDSAIILDPEPADLRAVLEFANVQLLELRYLDDQLDQILERSYQMLSRRGGWRAITLPVSAEERRQLSALQVDSAILLERVTNALKFLGEEYLARLYRLAAGRLHLAEWDGVITRKLATVESIYQKLTDRSTARRMELLEWVIILLIALEIVLSLIGS